MRKLGREGEKRVSVLGAGRGGSMEESMKVG